MKERLNRQISKKSKRKQTHKAAAGRERARRWKEWLSGPARVLTEIDIPKVIFRDARYWNDFLQHGAPHYYDPGPGFSWDIDQLPDDQARRLLAFLEASLSDDQKASGSQQGLYGYLRSRLRPRADMDEHAGV